MQQNAAKAIMPRCSIAMEQLREGNWRREMFDNALNPSAPDRADPGFAMQRARGRAAVALRQRAGQTRLAGLEQAGCAKAFLPRVSGAPEVVFLNTAGGLTGGDHLAFSLDLAAGGRAVATTQTAERAYAAVAATPAAEVDVRISAGAGAQLSWLPQETILFDRSALNRRTKITLQGDAELLFCETLVLGRAAMGETLNELRLNDHREIRRDGRPVLIDAVALDASVLARRRSAAGLAGCRAVALLGLVAPGAQDAAEGLRTVLKDVDGVSVGVSGWDGKCCLRLMAADGWPLRRALARAIDYLKQGAVPRVWQI